MRKETVFLGFLLFIVVFSGCTERLFEIKETRELMGTTVTITVYDKDMDNAKESVNSAFLEISRIEDLLSSYKNDSEIGVLNREKEIKGASEDLRANIEKALYYGKLSEGGFDITVQPILDLYKESFSVNKRPPTDSEVSEELSKVDYSEIIVEEDKISIGNEQKVTLGGIAKGYAVDKAIKALEREGINHALVNAGGDMRALGRKYGSTDWSIALANPRDKKDYITLVKLSDSAIVTSGDYERYFDENKTFHHIVNPLTGYSATELMSVTILADDAFDADAISTSVFVLGEEKGLELIESLDNVEGLIITREKEIIKSSGFD